MPKLTQEEEGTFENTDTVYLIPDRSVWDPYENYCAEREDRFVDFNEDIIKHEHRRRKIFDELDVCKLQVWEEMFEAAISSIANDEGISIGCNE